MEDKINMKMYKTRLENGLGIIPNAFGKPLYCGNLNFVNLGHLDLISGKLDLKNRLCKIDSNQSPSYNMFDITMDHFMVLATSLFSHF